MAKNFCFSPLSKVSAAWYGSSLNNSLRGPWSLTQMDFRIEVAKGLLEGYSRRHGRHCTVCPRSCLYGWRSVHFLRRWTKTLTLHMVVILGVRCVEQGKRKDHKQRTDAKSARSPFTLKNALKHSILNLTMGKCNSQCSVDTQLNIYINKW